MLLHLISTRLRPYSSALIVLLVLQLVATLASLFLPSLNGRIIDEGVTLGDTGFIVRMGVWMLAVSLIQIVATLGATYLASRASAGVGRRLRAEVFGAVNSFSAQEVGRFGAPTLISRSSNDVTQVQLLTQMSLTMLVVMPITMVGGLVMALREDVGLSWLMVVAVPLLGGIIGLVLWRMVPHFTRMQESVDEVNSILREQITGIRVVRAFVREQFEGSRFGAANRRYTDTSIAVGMLMAAVFPAVGIIFNLASIAVVWFGGQRVDSGAMQVGQLTAFMSYLMQVLMAVTMGTFIAMMVPRASVSAGRIGEVLTTESTVTSPASPVALPEGPLAVEFADVDFTYPGAEFPVLRDLTFRAEPGQVTAVIGSTGAGKSTLLNLIPRLYDRTAGTITLGGVDIAHAALDDLWRHLAVVPQRPYLFSGTVASTLRLGDEDASAEQIWEALTVAQASDFVTAMPDALEAPIAQGGTNVSGGQRQRLAIARALIRRAPVLLLDDSFSALDVATDARLRAALRPQMTDTTVIVVAQRVSSIVDADQIIVLEDGQIVGRGRHAELLASCATYREICESQNVAVGA